jgi:hypothetical protein
MEGLLSKRGAIALAVISYLALVRFLRFRRRNGLYRKFPFKTRKSLASMTIDDAMAIQQDLAQLEFPIVFSFAVFFAIFKVVFPPRKASSIPCHLTHPTLADLRHPLHIEAPRRDRTARKRLDGVQARQ